MEQEENNIECIKFNNTPVIPPLVTNDLVTEIKYYKKLALAVEERIKILEKGLKKNLIEIDDNQNPKIDTLIDIETDTSNNNALITVNQIENENNNKDESKLKTFNSSIDKSFSDEDKSCVNETLLGDSISSGGITSSIDLNQYINTPASIATDTTQTTPENWKPQVPKTLDIVPISLGVSQKNKKNSPSDEEKPKLVRRGSYVLETPSPMLLAHMQTTLGNIDYTPTPTDGCSVKRREWNISQGKSNWSTQKVSKETILTRSNSTNKSKKSSSGILNNRISKSVSNSKAGSPLDVYQTSTKSADCIQKMFAKECYSPKSAYSTVSRINKNASSNNKKNNKSIMVLGDAKKRSNSLANLNNVNAKVVTRRSDVKSNNSNVNKNSNTFSKTLSELGNPIKPKPVITSEKVITVFKEIQETHKKQMMDLMSRQQKEQLLMQENFKKQQIIFLAQIKKTFPEISVSSLADAISIKNLDSEEKLVNDEEKNNLNGSSKIEINSNSKTTIDDIPVGNSHFKSSSFSRRLFPIQNEDKIDNSKYTEKHIKAANIINAYAKGFLVRRLMKTEKVIALKNTYKEALHCMLRLHVEAPLNLSELNFHQRLQLQCDAASMNIVDLFSDSPAKRMEIISHDREIKKARADRPSSARSFSFATQRTLARKKLKEMGKYSSIYSSLMTTSCPARTRCQSWTPNAKERRNLSASMTQGIKRSISVSAVRKPWR